MRILEGTPYLQHQSRKAGHTASAVSSGSGTASAQRVKRSVMINTNLLPDEDVGIFNKSADINWNGRLVSIGSRGAEEAKLNGFAD